MNKLLKPNNKLLSAAVILLIIIGVASFTASVTYVIAQSGAGSLYVEEGVYPGAPSYTVWREGSTYFAKDENGHVAYSGSNASQILQNALDARNLVFLKNQTYSIDSNITVYEETTLIGEAIDSVVIQRTTDDVMVIVNSSVAWTEAITIERLTIHGNSKNGTLVSVESGRMVVLRDVAIRYSNDIGIHVKSGSWSVLLDNLEISYNGVGAKLEANAVTMQNCISRLNVDTNLNITSEGHSIRIVNSVIEKASGTNAWNCYITGGAMESFANHLIQFSHFEDAPSGGGNLRIEGVSSVNITSVLITGCYFSEDAASIYVADSFGAMITQNYIRGTGLGLNITATAYNTTVFLNHFDSTSTITDNGVDSNIQYNLGYP